MTVARGILFLRNLLRIGRGGAASGNAHGDRVNYLGAEVLAGRAVGVTHGKEKFQVLLNSSCIGGSGAAASNAHGDCVNHLDAEVIARCAVGVACGCGKFYSW